MKKIMMFLIVLLSTQIIAQTFHKDSLGLPALNGAVGMQEVIQIDSATKKELYSRAKMWVSEAFKSANNVIQLDDADNGILLLKGITMIEVKTLVKTQMNMRFTLKIEAKEGKYRYSLTNITVADIEEAAERYWKGMYKSFRPPVTKGLQDLVDMLKKGMIKTIEEKW
jgi:hypothetical protein